MRNNVKKKIQALLKLSKSGSNKNDQSKKNLAKSSTTKILANGLSTESDSTEVNAKVSVAKTKKEKKLNQNIQKEISGKSNENDKKSSESKPIKKPNPNKSKSIRTSAFHEEVTTALNDLKKNKNIPKSKNQLDVDESTATTTTTATKPSKKRKIKTVTTDKPTKKFKRSIVNTTTSSSSSSKTLKTKSTKKPKTKRNIQNGFNVTDISDDYNFHENINPDSDSNDDDYMDKFFNDPNQYSDEEKLELRQNIQLDSIDVINNENDNIDDNEDKINNDIDEDKISEYESDKLLNSSGDENDSNDEGTLMPYVKGSDDNDDDGTSDSDFVYYSDSDQDQDEYNEYFKKIYDSNETSESDYDDDEFDTDESDYEYSSYTDDEFTDEYTDDDESDDLNDYSVYIKKGDAKITKLDNDSVQFNESFEIIEMNEKKFHESNDIEIDQQSTDSCPELVPIESIPSEMISSMHDQCTTTPGSTDENQMPESNNERPVIVVRPPKNQQWTGFPIHCSDLEMNESDNDDINEIMDSHEIKQIPLEQRPIIVKVNMGTKQISNDARPVHNELKTKSKSAIIDDGDVVLDQSLPITSDANHSDANDDVNNDNENGLGADSSTAQYLDDSYQQPINPPKFYNALSSRHVLMILRDRLFFNGVLEVELLIGGVEIFGYTLKPNEPMTAFSPRGHSLIYLNPIPPTATGYGDIDKQLNRLKSIFLLGDLEQVRRDFNPQNGDTLLLIEKVTNNSAIHMIKKYMKQNVFPNTATLNNRRTNYSTEYILATQFWHSSRLGIRINPQWQQVQLSESSRAVVLGGKGVGKSTFIRHLINTHLNRFPKMLLIDLDIGQPEMFLPQTVSATIIEKPLLGAGFLQNVDPICSYLFGHINVVISPIKYIQCVLKLLEFCTANPDCQNIPWIINTMGYCHGFGLEIAAAILKAFRATDAIQIKSFKKQENFTRILSTTTVDFFDFKIVKRELKSFLTSGPSEFNLHLFETMCSKWAANKWEMAPKDNRYMMILSRLGQILQHNWQWLSDVEPICTNINDLEIIVPNDCDDSIDTNIKLGLINASLVYLCQKTNDSLMKSNCHKDIVQCYGIGIVRNVNYETGSIYLLPALTSMEQLQHINALAICSIPIPISIVLNQSGQVDGILPYVYNNQNFIGSRQVVQISYRPEQYRRTQPNEKWNN